MATILKRVIQLFCQQVPVLPLVLRCLSRSRVVRYPRTESGFKRGVRKLCCWIARYEKKERPIVREVTYRIDDKSFKMRLDISEFSECWLYFDFPNHSLIDLIRKGGTHMMDVGANLGIYTLAAAQFFDRVTSVEPAPDTYQKLVYNIELCGAGNVTSHEVAVSDKAGTATLHANPLNRGGNSLQGFSQQYKQASGQSEWEQFDVALKPLDDLVNTDDPVDLIKIDVEGHEVEAVVGALEIIGRHKPVLFVEVSTQENFDLIVKHLSDEYRVWDPTTRSQSNSWVYPDCVFSVDRPW